MEKRKNEIGNKFGKLLVIGKSERKTSSGSSFWLCECECGQIKEIAGATLRNGQTKSCGCNNGGESNPETGRKKLFNSLKNNAKSRNLIFELDYDTFVEITKQNCYLCGDEPNDKHYGYTRRRYSKNNDNWVVCNSIDRLDNTIGYTKDNSKPCCFMCNRIKSDFSIEDLIVKLEKIKNKWKEN
jgi:hypothetical protein